MTDTSSHLSPLRSPTAMLADGYDVFISHASEDKKRVARPLARQLESLGFRVWLDETEITVGDSLRAVIDRGLQNSRFGVVILSPSFFKKSWTQYELDGLLAKSDGSRKIILPVWHKVTRNEVASFSLGLAGLAAVHTDLGIKEVANRLSRAILRESIPVPRPLPPRRWHEAVNLRRLTAAIAASAITVLAGQATYMWQLTPDGESKDVAPSSTPTSGSANLAPFSLRIPEHPTKYDAASYEKIHDPIELVDGYDEVEETRRALDNYKLAEETQRTIDNLRRIEETQRILDSVKGM